MDMVWYLSPQETQHGIHTSFSWLMRESETMAKILCVLMVVYHAIMRFGIWECAYIIHFRSLKLFFFLGGENASVLYFLVCINRPPLQHTVGLKKTDKLQPSCDKKTSLTDTVFFLGKKSSSPPAVSLTWHSACWNGERQKQILFAISWSDLPF